MNRDQMTVQIAKEDIMNYIAENPVMDYYDMKAVEKLLNTVQDKLKDPEKHLFSESQAS